MDEFEDELFLERRRKHFNLWNQKKRNQMKRTQAEIIDPSSASPDDAIDFFHLPAEEPLEEFSLDVRSILDVQPAPLIEDSVDESSIDETESILGLIHHESMESVHSGEAQVTESELDDPAIDRPLHLYTDLTCSQFLSSFLRLLRSTNMCKSRAQSFLKLIQSAMPQPNRLPVSMSQLLRDLDIDDNLFVKRAVCTSCKMDFVSTSAVACKDCNTTDGSSRALIYDTDARALLSMLLTRLHRSIQSFRSTIMAPSGNRSSTDLPFGRIYQRFLRQNSTQQFVNLVLHLDGRYRSSAHLHHSGSCRIRLSLSL